MEQINLTNQIPGTGRALGNFNSWQDAIKALCEQAGNSIQCPGAGTRLFKFLGALPEEINSTDHVVYSTSNDKGTLYLHVKSSDGRNPLTRKPLDPTWKNYTFTRDELNALPL